MKPTSFFFLLIIALFFSSCSNDKNPITDPTEMYEKGNALLLDGSLKQAKSLLEQSANEFRQRNNNSQLCKVLTSLVETNLKLGEYRAAFTASDEALILMRKEGDVHGEIRIAMLEGELYSKMHMPDRALNRYRSAYATASAFDDKTASIEVQLKLASVKKRVGDLEEAQDIYKNILTHAQSSGERQYIAVSLGGIGSVYRLQQRNVEALNSLTQALASVSRTHDPKLIAQLHEEVASLHILQNNPNAALRDLREAINTLRRARIDKEYESVLLFKYGNIFESNKNFSEAKRYYTEAMELARSLGDKISENYLYIFLVRCNFNLMTPQQQEQNRQKLQQSYEQIAKKFQECGHIAGEGYLYTQLGKMSEVEDDLLKARAFYLKAVTLDQNTLADYYDEEIHTPYLTALGILSFHSDWYALLSSVLVKLQREEEALKILELGCLKQLSLTFQNLDLSLRNPNVKLQTKDVQTRIWRAKMLEAELKARISKQNSRGSITQKQQSLDNKELNQLRTEIESVKQLLRNESKQIISEYSNYETLVLPFPVDIASLKKNIPRGALAVEFLLTENQLYIFALSNSELTLRTSAVPRDTIIQMITEFKRLLQDPTVYSGEAGEASITPMTRFAKLSTQLYDVLLRPVDDLFEQNLIIVANEEFEGFPFHAIERQDAKGNVKYVIEFTSVDYIPSLASLRYHTTPAVRINDVVAFGNPTGKNWSVDYELRDIRSFFKGASVMVGLETSWDNLKSIKADILQISTEFGQPNTELPLGNLVLSDGLTVEQSTAIQFEKLSELNVIPVIILSNHYGQGIGLSANHALLYRINGTSDVFLNAWLANRKAAKFFSENFYIHLSKGLAPGDAYRQALLNLIRIREVSHPRSWGQFFHFGVG